MLLYNHIVYKTEVVEGIEILLSDRRNGDL